VASILVTGVGGFIASHLAGQLIARGDGVVGVDDLSSGSRENVPAGVELLTLDLADPGVARALPDRVDAVLHLAGQSSGEISHDNPPHDLRANTLATLHLLQWCRERGIGRFVYASSMSVYGQTERLPVAEGHPCQPLSFYGVAKLASEHYARLYGQYGVEPTVLRMFNVYGPGQNLANLRQGMVSIYLAYLLRRQPVVVKGSRERFRDFVFVDDVVSAWIAALDSPAARGRVYNVASGQKTHVWELLEAQIRAFGHDPATYPVSIEAGTPGDQFGIWADVSRLRDELGWAPRVPLQLGIQRMVDWARSLA
jgi:UDP-glucose 4-epimerase